MAGDLNILREFRDTDRTIGGLQEELRLHKQNCHFRHEALSSRVDKIESQLTSPPPKKTDDSGGSPGSAGLGPLLGLVAGLFNVYSVIRYGIILTILIAVSPSHDVLSAMEKAAKILSSLR